MPSKYQPLKPAPGSEYQPYPPGPIEKRIRKLENMVWALLNKIPKGPPIDPKDFTPFSEGKHDCKKVHPEMSHKKWEEKQEKK